MADQNDPLRGNDSEETPIDFDDDTAPIDFDEEESGIDLEGGGEPGSGTSKIRSFGTGVRHSEQWDRTPNVTGQGAIHCKVFYTKLREDAITYMERQINEWLDAHPEYEVKHVTSSIGEMKTKTISEAALIVTVWV